MENVSSEKVLRIKGDAGRIKYFSRGVLAYSLFSICMDDQLAFTIATNVEKRLSSYKQQIKKESLIKIIYDEIYKHSPDLAERYEIFEQESSYKPIIILLGGVPGIGKSTIASILSQRLEISNIIGTDMVREVLRKTISDKLVPEIHCSSYEAHRFLKPQINPILRPSIVGYEEQSRHIIVGVEAAIQTALYERENTIIEGVHLSPNIVLPKILQNSHVIVFLLYLANEEEHKQRFFSRETMNPAREAEKYTNAFEEIRKIQDYLLEQAYRTKVHIIETSSTEEVVKEIMDHVWERITLIASTEKEKQKEKES